MTAKQKKIVKEYIDLFALGNWDITVSIDDSVEQGKDANCYFCVDSMTAMIFIHPNADFCISLYHELIHLCFAKLDDFLKNILVNEFVPQNQKEYNNKIIEKYIEEAVIKIERSITKNKEGDKSD